MAAANFGQRPLRARCLRASAALRRCAGAGLRGGCSLRGANAAGPLSHEAHARADLKRVPRQFVRTTLRS